MPERRSYLTNPASAVDRYIDAHLRLMEIEAHPSELAYTPEGARLHMQLRRRMETARRRYSDLRSVLAQTDVTREQLLRVYEQHGLALPRGHERLDLDGIIRHARRTRNRLYEQIVRLGSRLEQSPLSIEAELLRYELQELRHSGVLQHSAQPAYLHTTTELTALQRAWRDQGPPGTYPSEQIRRTMRQISKEVDRIAERVSALDGLPHISISQFRQRMVRILQEQEGATVDHLLGAYRGAIERQVRREDFIRETEFLRSALDRADLDAGTKDAIRAELAQADRLYGQEIDRIQRLYRETLQEIEAHKARELSELGRRSQGAELSAAIDSLVRADVELKAARATEQALKERFERVHQAIEDVMRYAPPATKEALYTQIALERQRQRLVPAMPSIGFQDEAMDTYARRQLHEIMQIRDPAQRALAVEKLKAEVGGGAWLREVATIEANLSRDAWQFQQEFEGIRRVEMQEDLMMDRVRARRRRRFADRYEEVVGSVARYRTAGAPALERLSVTPEELVGEVIYRRGGRGAWDPLRVLDVVADDAGGPASVRVQPYTLSLRGGEARLHLRTSPYELVRWYRSHAVSDAIKRGNRPRDVRRAISSPPLAGVAVETSLAMRMQDAVQRATEFAERQAKERATDRVLRRIVSSEAPEHLIEPVELLHELLLGDKYTVSATRIGGSEGGRVPLLLAEQIAEAYPNLLYTSNLEQHMDDIASETISLMLEDKSWMESIPSAKEARRKYMERFSRVLDRNIHRATKSVLGSMFDMPISAMDPLAAAMTQVRRAFEEQGIDVTEKNLLGFIRTLRESGPVPSSLQPLLGMKLDAESIQAWRMVTGQTARGSLSLDTLEEQRRRLDALADDSIVWADTTYGLDVARGVDPGAEHIGDTGPLEVSIAEHVGDPAKLDIDGPSTRRSPALTRTRWQQQLLQGADPVGREQLIGLIRAFEDIYDIDELSDRQLLELLEEFSPRLLGRPLTRKEKALIVEKGWQELLELGRRDRQKRLYQLYSLEQLRDMERVGLLERGELFIEYQGRTVAARLERLPELGDVGYHVVIPSTGARIRLIDEGGAMAPFQISADELATFEVGKHPLHGSLHPMTGMPGPVMSRPPFSPRLVRPLGYGVGEVLHAADIMRQGPGLFGAIDMETTGLLDDYRALGMERYFRPTEIGIATYSSDTGALMSQERLFVRPTQDIERHVQRLARMTPDEFVAQQVARHGASAEAAARQVYQQSLRSYAALADAKFLSPTATYDLAELQAAALRGLEAAKTGIDDPELGRIASTDLRGVRRRFKGLLEELADASAQQGLGRRANIVAANAARAEAQWLPQLVRGIDWSGQVRWHDPQPIYRMLHPEDPRYSLGHIASRLGIEHDASRLHSALADADLTAEAYRRLVSDPRLVTALDAARASEYSYIEPGQILHRVSGGGRGLWRVDEVVPGTDSMEASITLSRILGRPEKMTISGASWGDIEQRLYGRYVPVAMDREFGIDIRIQSRGGRGVYVGAAREEAARLLDIEQRYWADRARRDIQAGFVDPSSNIFRMLSEPVSERRAILSQLEAPPYASARGQRAYRRTIERFVTGMESQLHHGYFRQVRRLMETGLLDHPQAGALLKTYEANLMHLLPPMRRATLEEAALGFDLPVVGTRRIPVSSLEATHRSVVGAIHSIAEAQAHKLPSSRYFPLALEEFRAALGDLVPEGASIEEMAAAIYQRGQERFRAGELLIQDMSVGFLPDGEGREAAVRSIRDLHKTLLKEPMEPLRRLEQSPFRDSPFIAGLPMEEVAAIAEGRASPIGAGSSGEAVRQRRALWRNIADTAFRDTEQLRDGHYVYSRATQAARDFLGLGTGDLGTARLPFEVDGELGMRLGDLTPSQMASVREKVRSRSTFPMHDNMYSIIRRYLAETRVSRQATSEAASTAAAAIRSARTPRGAMWAGLAGAGALGLFALGTLTAGGARRRAEESASLRPGTGPIGLDIEISGVRRGSGPSPNDIVHAAVMGVQQQSTVPLDVNVHQVDDTRTVNRHWAQELMLRAIQG